VPAAELVVVHPVTTSLEEGVWGRNLVKVSPQQVRHKQILTTTYSLPIETNTPASYLIQLPGWPPKPPPNPCRSRSSMAWSRSTGGVAK
jgi:hypothetical protein